MWRSNRTNIRFEIRLDFPKVICESLKLYPDIYIVTIGSKAIKYSLKLAQSLRLENNLIVSIEAGSINCWHKYLKKDDVAIGIDKFGKSAPYKEIYEEMNLTSNKIANIIQKKLSK